MREKDELGQRGEEAACLFLIGQGHKIHRRNYRLGNLEIDIITLNPKGEYELVEVKTRSSSIYGNASDCLTRQKIKNLKHAASRFAYAEKIRLERISLSFVAIDYTGNKANIKYFPNILGF
ncbi:MAG: YraN family protein [Patescibacteria group bacterium]|nr:YraN family protein [Patescibacteria group bacterium]